MFAFAPLSAAAAGVPIGENASGAQGIKEATVGEGSGNVAGEEEEAGKVERNGWFKEGGETYYCISNQV